MASALNKIKQTLLPTNPQTANGTGTSDPTLTSENAQPDVIAPRGDNRQRGPVEEVIAKRMRQLGKKLLRYRTYAAKDPASLNADQRNALASLPALEGGYKELEDLIKEKGAVDEQELIQAAKLREAKEAAEKGVHETIAGRLSEQQTTFTSTISSFLRLHALLHPAKPSDHAHITFTQLNLPSHLQDEVQATDVLRVGRMYEDLSTGGEAGRDVVSALLAGSTGQDEENDHIHRLLNLVDRPQTSSTAVEESPVENQNIGVEQSAGLPQTEEASEISPSDSGIPNGHSSETATGAGLVFLQDSELDKQGGKKEIQEDESFEVIPMPEAHETSENTPSAASNHTAPSADAFSAKPTSTNWADLDEDELHVPTQSATPTTIHPSAAITETRESTIPLLTEDTPAIPEIISGTPAPALEAPVDATSTSVPANLTQAGGARRGGRGGGIPQKPREPVRSTVVDEDGFERKVRRQASGFTQGNRGGRGRGGFGNGNAENRVNGNGNGSGEGRGYRGGNNGDTRANGSGAEGREGGEGGNGYRGGRGGRARGGNGGGEGRGGEGRGGGYRGGRGRGNGNGNGEGRGGFKGAIQAVVQAVTPEKSS